MESSIEVVEFALADGRYAIDIHLIREIVEMVPITPIPRAPPYITGVINLRGEITNIVNLNKHLALPPKELSKSQKIIVFTADTIKGKQRWDRCRLGCKCGSGPRVESEAGIRKERGERRQLCQGNYQYVLCR